MNVADPPAEADRRNAKFLEFRATFRPLLMDPTLTDPPKSFVAAVRLPLDDARVVTDDLENRDDWMNAMTVMTNIYQTTNNRK